MTNFGRTFVRNFVAIGGPLLGMAIAIWITLPAWGLRPFGGVDVIMHVMRTTFGVERLVGHGRLDGWFPAANLGYPLFLLHGPGVAWLTTLVRAASLWQLPTVAALNIAVLGCFVAYPLAVTFMARSAGFGRRASGLAGILALLVSYPFAEGIRGLFGIGLIENQVGALFVWLAFGGLIRVVCDPRPRWILFASASLAAVLITHLPSAMVLAPLAAFSLPWFIVGTVRPGAAVARLCLTGGLSAGLAGFWLLPLIAHRDLVGLSVPGWRVPSLREAITAILYGALLFRPHIVWLVLAGWAFALLKTLRGYWRPLAMIVAPLLYLTLGHTLFHRLPNHLTMQMAHRGLGYAGVMATFPLAMAIATLVRRYRLLGDAAALAAAGVLAVVSLNPMRNLIRPSPEAVPPLREAAYELARIVPSGARFSTPQHVWYKPESIGGAIAGPDRWLAWQSGRNSLSGLTPESSSTPWVVSEAERLDSQPPEAAAETLVRLGVTHVVAPTPALTERLVASPRFMLVWRSPPVAILAVGPRPGFPEPSSLTATERPARARLVSADPEHPRVEVWTDEPTAASVAVAWSPKWHGTLNGESYPLDRTPDGLISVKLPVGFSRLALDYLPDKWDRVGQLISLGIIGAELAWVLLHMRASRTRTERAG